MLNSQSSRDDVWSSSVKKNLAEAAAYRAEAKYHNLQSERLLRARDAEDAEVASQRILDFTAEVDFGSVRQAINALEEMAFRSDEPITVRLITPGGDVLAGLALIDHIRDVRKRGVQVNTLALGICASMGTVILQAGEVRRISKSTWLMIHEGEVQIEGRMAEVRDTSAWNARITAQLLGILTERSKMTQREVKRRWERKDWWLSSEDAIEAGFADEVIGS